MKKKLVSELGGDKNEFSSLSNKSLAEGKPFRGRIVHAGDSQCNAQEGATMKVKEISVSVSQKLNMGNYESKGFGLSATAELSEQDDLLQVKQSLTNSLNKMLDFEINKIKECGSK